MVTVAGKQVSPISFGLMTLSFPGKYKKSGKDTTDEEAFAVMKEALAHGATFWNGGEFYGSPAENSLTLLKRYFDKYPEDADKVTICIKGCAHGADHGPACDSASVRKSVENCVRLLGNKKKLDIFEPARVDPNVPIEETYETLNELIKEGLIGAAAISEAVGSTIRRAAKVSQLAHVETEVNMFEDNIFRNDIAQACADLNIPILGYGTLGKGFLTGTIKSRQDLTPVHQIFPRFSEEHFPKNLELVEKVNQAAKEAGVTPAQFAIGWVMNLSKKPGMPQFIPLFGSTSVQRTAENLTNPHIPAEKFEEIDEFLKTFTASGDRYPEMWMKHVNK